MHCEICGKRSTKNVRELEFTCQHSIALCAHCSKNLSQERKQKCATCEIEESISESETESAEEEKEITIKAEEAAKAKAVEETKSQPAKIISANISGFSDLFCINDVVKIRNVDDGPQGIVFEIFPQISEAIVIWPGNGIGVVRKMEHFNDLIRIGKKEAAN